MHRATLALLVLLAAFAACGEPPRPVEESGPPATARARDAGSEPAARMPANHPPLDAPAPAPLPDGDLFAGEAVLRGELARREAGWLFVNVRSEHAFVPFYSKKISLADAPLPEAEGGERVLPFSLDASNHLDGRVPAEGALLEIYFDADGYVDSKDDQGERLRVPARVGDLSIALVYAPESLPAE